MSLATRCTACGTVFRVVQDQLKVSEGWVRCGRCDAVFNALEGLFDLERVAPSGEALAPQPHAVHASTDHEIDPLEDSLESTLTTTLRSEPVNAPDAPEEFVGGAEHAVEATVSQSWPHNPFPPEDALSPTPEFLRQPGREGRRVSARLRFAMWGVGAMLSLILTAQAVHHFRDAISANWPPVRQTLVAWCKSAGCTIGVLHRIEDVAVENSALTRASGRDGFVFSVALRNRGRLAVALPSLELSLTDSNGQLLARRALEPGDFQNEPMIAPGADATLQLTLASDDLRIAGYAVEIFYP